MIERAAIPRYSLYLAVLPRYRTECMRILTEELGQDLSIFVSPAHMDESVRTGIPRELYKTVPMTRIFQNRAFIQTGSWQFTIRAQTAVLDLNPRSLTAWLLLSIRYVLRRRTLLWGHVHPQAGPSSRTAVLRRIMRHIADGTISYTYRDAEKAIRDIPGSAVWVAPNSLYREKEITPAVGAKGNGSMRNAVLYVGRFAPEKKVSLLMEGFAEAAQKVPEMRLILVGSGEEEPRLRSLALKHDVGDKVKFAGWVDDLDQLLPLYARAFCTVSPGFAGLGLTQSLGFGVPMLVADNEPHSPEIELDASGGVEYFESGSCDALGSALVRRWGMRDELPHRDLSEYTRTRYSAEAMARGLREALENSLSSMRNGMSRDGSSK